MSFEPKSEIEYLMELVSKDRTWFISNLKTFELDAWLLFKDSRNWNLMIYYKLKVTRDRIWVYWWVDFDLNMEMRCLPMH